MLDGEEIDGVKYNGMIVTGPEGVGKVSFINNLSLEYCI
jgi:putative ribosome biogenesis GTPase RsgA